MEGNKTKPRALLVFGAPCSGKTTFAEKFARKFGLAYYDLVRLREEEGFSEEDVLTILSLILRTKQTVIIEGGLDTEAERTIIRNLCRSQGYDPSLIWIQTDVSTIRMRLKSKFRSVSKAKEFYNEAVSEMEAPTDIEKPIILSGKHTFETQTKHVVVGLADLTESK
ncbi:AAA family ATPase [Candidatus Saccharibacteria bacterium]|nr:AAA family ATPase [Candidatus Saccharibacteria bacterium]